MKKTKLFSAFLALTTAFTSFSTLLLYGTEGEELNETPIISSSDEAIDENTEFPIPYEPDLDAFRAHDYYTFEGISDGETDIADALQNCVNEHKYVKIPSGRYYLSHAVSMPDNSAVCGEDGTVILLDAQTSAFKGVGIERSEGVEPKLADNIYIGNMKCEYKSFSQNTEFTDAKEFAFFCGISCSNVVVEKITIEKGGIAYVGSYGTYIGGRYDEMSHNIAILDCVCDGIDGKVESGGAIGATVWDSEKFVLRNLVCTNVMDGIRVYSSECKFNSPEYTKTKNERGCRDGLIEGCEVSSVRWGGIMAFGSERITVKDCTIVDVTDAGVDFEGCKNCIAEGNTAVDAVVGGIWQYTGTIVIKDNYCKSTVDHGLLCNHVNHIFGNTEYYERASVLCGKESQYIIVGNTFESVSGIGYVGMYYASPSMGNIVFSDNICKNVCFTTSYYLNGYNSAADKTGNMDIRSFTVENNTFEFNTRVHSPMKGCITAFIGRNAAESENDKVVAKIRGNKITCTYGSRLCGIYVGNEKSLDNFSLELENNTLKNCDISVINASENFYCDASVKGNVCDRITVEGYAELSVSDNKKENGKELPLGEMSLSSMITTPTGTKTNGVAEAKKIPYGISVGISGSKKQLWNGAWDYSLGKRVNGNGYTDNVSFKPLWNIESDYLKLYFLVKLDKTEDFTRSDKGVISLFIGNSENGEVTDKSVNGGRIEFNFAGTVSSKKGSLFSDGCKVSISYGIDADKKGATALIAVFIDSDVDGIKEIMNKLESGKSVSVGFNIAAFNYKAENGSVGFTAGAEETDISKFGVLTLGSTVRMKINGEILRGDVNGDGEIKGNDATMLLKKLADWNVIVDEENSDCNGDGKIKGSDSTMLLKKLAGWDIAFG